MRDHAGHVMLVAGGSGSIGSAIASAAVAAGWTVAVHGRSAMSAAAAAARARGDADADVEAFAADFTGAGAIEELVARAGAWRGRLDAVVDCTALGPPRRLTGAFADTEPDAYAALLDQSVGNVQRLAHAALPWLRRDGGTLIAFASDAGRYAAPKQAIIGASRAAIIGFVRNLSTETARDGVRVHCISPTFVDGTDSARRLAAVNAERIARLRQRAGLGLPTPADIAPLVLFLCSDAARRMTGQVLSINGGANA
jgi:NAD(P)-dependent dehydrogenase (short-subunit alcohol dehydrogenase family)